MYTDFAAIYDLLMQDVDYAAWSVHLLRLLESRGVTRGASCVECACGTGSLTIPLSRAGLKMTGVDLSGEMLSAAMLKARGAGCFIPFIRQNMASLSLHLRRAQLPHPVRGFLVLRPGMGLPQARRRAAL